MKILVVAALILCVSFQVFAVNKEDIKKKMKECQEETGVDKKHLIEKALEGEVKDDPKLKGIVECLFKKMKIMEGYKVAKDKFKVFLEAAKPFMNREKIQEKAVECVNKEGETAKEKMFAIFKCALNK